MRSVLMVLCLHVGHMLRCDRVVRLGRARRIHLVRDLQKLLDVVGQGVVGFDDVRFVVCDPIVTGFFREDELVGC